MEYKEKNGVQSVIIEAPTAVSFGEETMNVLPIEELNDYTKESQSGSNNNS